MPTLHMKAKNLSQNMPKSKTKFLMPHGHRLVAHQCTCCGTSVCRGTAVGNHCSRCIMTLTGYISGQLTGPLVSQMHTRTAVMNGGLSGLSARIKEDAPESASTQCAIHMESHGNDNYFQVDRQSSCI